MPEWSGGRATTWGARRFDEFCDECHCGFPGEVVTACERAPGAEVDGVVDGSGVQPPSPEKMTAVAAEYGIEVIGPPGIPA